MAALSLRAILVVTRPPTPQENTMPPAAKLVLGLIAVAVVLGIVGVPFWVIVLVIVGLPVGAYLMLDPAQRAKLRNNSRRQIGS